MKERNFLTVIIFTALFLLVGCGAIFTGTKQEISINSNPPGAKVTIKPTGQTGITPFTVSLEKKNQYTLLFEMEGYKPKEAFIDRNMRAGILILDILNGLVGVVVDAATGGWYKLSPTTVTVTLERADNALKDLPESITLNLTFTPVSENEEELAVTIAEP